MKIVDIGYVTGRADRLQPIMQIQQLTKTALTTAQQWDWTRNVDLLAAANEEIQDILKITFCVNGISVVDANMENNFLDGGWERGQDSREPAQDKVGVCTWITVHQGICDTNATDHRISNNPYRGRCGNGDLVCRQRDSYGGLLSAP